MAAVLTYPLTFQQEMSGLKKEIKRRGYYRKQPGRMVTERLGFLSIQLLGIAGYWSVGNVGVQAAAIVLTTVGILGAAAHTHTASHQGLFEPRWLNNGMVFLGYPFGIGLSATYWWHKHLVVHHPNPNIHGVDEDIDFMPYFVLTQEDLNQASAFGRVWYQWQGLIFPLSLSLNVANMQLSGWKQLIGTLTNKSAPKTGPLARSIFFAGALWLVYSRAVTFSTGCRCSGFLSALAGIQWLRGFCFACSGPFAGRSRGIYFPGNSGECISSAISHDGKFQSGLAGELAVLRTGLSDRTPFVSGGQPSVLSSHQRIAAANLPPSRLSASNAGLGRSTPKILPEYDPSEAGAQGLRRSKIPNN